MHDQQLETFSDYAYRPGNIEEIRFRSQGDCDRSFTILVVERSPGSAEPRSGIAVYDNDNDRVVLDDPQDKDETIDVVCHFKMAHLSSMSWQEFSAWCREHDGYLGGIADIDTPSLVPISGNLARQARPAAEIRDDARSDFVRAISADPETPYHFPPANREMMADEIADHLCFIEKNGLISGIAWDIRLKRAWNRTGRVAQGFEVDPRQDENWCATVRNSPQLVTEAARRALAPYTSGPATILDMDRYPAEFRRAGRNGGFLVLTRFAGHFMSATRDISIRNRIRRMRDDALEALWVCVRVMDVETSERQRTLEMEHQMNALRVEYEHGLLEGV